MGDTADDRNRRIAAGTKSGIGKLQNSPALPRDSGSNRLRNQGRVGSFGFKPNIGESDGEEDSGGDRAGVGRRGTGMIRIGRITPVQDRLLQIILDSSD